MSNFKALLVCLVTIFTVSQITSLKAQWTPTNGPTGGNIRCVKASQTTIFLSLSAGSVLVGRNIHTIFRSTDNGLSWIKSNRGIPDTVSVNDFALLGTNVLAATDVGVYRSQDNGNNWTLMNTGFPIWIDVRTLLVEGTTVYAGTERNGIFRSNDDGFTWEGINSTGLPTSSSGPYYQGIRKLITSGTTLFALIGSSTYTLYRSTDNGNTWQKPWMMNEVPNGFRYIHDIVVDGTTLFVGTPMSLFSSTDNGTTWEVRENGLPAKFLKEVNALFNSGTSLYAVLDVDGMYRSTDNGSSWFPATSNAIASVTHRIERCGTTLLATTVGKGIMRSTDNGVTWEISNKGLWFNQITCFSISGDALLVGSVGGTYRTTDIGASWLDADNGMPLLSTVNAVVSTNGTAFAGAQKGVYRSVDNGLNWIASSNGLPLSSQNFYGILSMCVAGNYIFAGSQQLGLYRSADNGLNWELTGWDTTVSPFTIESMKSAGSTLYIAMGGELHRTSDYGQTMESLTSGWPKGETPIEILLSGSTVFATNSMGIFSWTDSNHSWQQADNGLPMRSYFVPAMAASGNTLFAGCRYGVYRSTDNGKNWEQINFGLTDTLVQKLIVYNGYLFAGTVGGAVWKRRLSEITSGVTLKSQTVGFALTQNSPNPSIGYTSVGFSIPSRTHVTLTLYDLFGQRIKSLVNGIMEPGEHSVELNTTDLPNSAYFYRLETAEFQSTRTLMIAK